MSIWIEVHCDYHFDEGERKRGILLPICYSDSNDNPGIMFSNSGIGRMRQLIFEDAKEKGWKRKGNAKKWICPGCQYALEYKKQEPME